ncbi:MAG: hypothetical protein PUB21_03175 [Bacteroidales bacterium]|nr:hypothetical protein [Bacteroidales bacterium]
MKIKTFLLSALVATALAEPAQHPLAGADNSTPSKAMYFSWINHGWEGTNEEQTLVNYDFFRWLYDTYGMKLDIYLFDAGNMDGCFLSWLHPFDDCAYEISVQPENDRPHSIGQVWLNDRAFYCGAPNFKHKFPEGLHKVKSKFDTMGTRLGMWLGPDGYGSTPADAEYRRNMLVELARDYNMALFKFDACCSGLRPDKQGEFVRTMQEVRKYSPDLIALNHRINLGEDALKYMTTFLWGGQETYVDILISNQGTATHARVANLDRGLPPGLQRITEDHGVCLSSCLDYWQDDLILQAFNRNLIVAPEIYGNPWLLKDRELAELAGIFNLHRAYNDILANGMLLPENLYGKHAVSRGDDHTRFVTMVNLGWERVQHYLTVGEEIGIKDDGVYEVRQFHPTERILATLRKGESVPVTVESFRSSLVRVVPAGEAGFGIEGIDYQVLRKKEGVPTEIELLGAPGKTYEIKLKGAAGSVTLDGKKLKGTGDSKEFSVKFPGTKLKKDTHRQLDSRFVKEGVPANAEFLFETAMFGTDNNALEVRSLQRSGKTLVPEVQAARDAFFNSGLFVELGIWDKQLFDGDPETRFCHHKSRYESVGFTRPDTYKSGIFRLDIGKPTLLDSLVFKGVSAGYRCVAVEASDDLKKWDNLDFIQSEGVLKFVLNNKKYRYFRITDSPEAVAEIEGYYRGEMVARDSWKANNLFPSYENSPVVSVWRATVDLDETAPGSYLTVPLEGEHGTEGAYVVFDIDGKYISSPERITSYPANCWEGAVVAKDRDYTYLLPLTSEMKGKKLDVYVLSFNKDKNDFVPSVWMTSASPYLTKKVVIE